VRHRSRRQKHLACCKAPPHMSSQKRCMMKPRRLRLAAYVVGWGERVGTTARCWRGVRACSDAAVETRHCIRVLPFGSLKPIPVGVRCVGRVKGTRAFGAPHRADVILDVEFVVRVCGTTAAARALVVVQGLDRADKVRGIFLLGMFLIVCGLDTVTGEEKGGWNDDGDDAAPHDVPSFRAGLALPKRFERIPRPGHNSPVHKDS